MTTPGKFEVTFFDHYSARYKRQQAHTLAELGEMIELMTGASAKTRCPGSNLPSSAT